MMTCPEHGTEMYYSWSADLYACQDSDCRYAKGVESGVLVEAWNLKTADSHNGIGSDRVEPQQKGANMKPQRRWDGKAVIVSKASGVPEGIKPIGVYLTEKAARTVALSLDRLKQTFITLPEEVQELLTAIDYVTLGDENSTQLHDAMNVGKGMTPDGGYKTPENRSPITGGPRGENFGKPTGERYS